MYYVLKLQIIKLRI